MLGELPPWVVLEEGKDAVLSRSGSRKTAFPKAGHTGHLWGCQRAKLLALCLCFLTLERNDARGEMSRRVCLAARWWAPAAGATGLWVLGEQQVLVLPAYIPVS